MSKDLIGKYQGTLFLYSSKQADSTAVPASIQIFPSVIHNQYTIANGVLMSSTVWLNGQNLELPQTVVASSSQFKIVEYASGTLVDSLLTVDFHQDYLDSAGKRTDFKDWKGILKKQ